MQEPIERYGTVAAWSAELGVPLLELQTELGVGILGDVGSSQVRQAVATILVRKKEEKEERISKIRAAVQTPLNLFALEHSSSRSRLKLKDIGIKDRKEFKEYFGLHTNPWEEYIGRLELAALVFGMDHPDVAIRIAEREELLKKPDEAPGPVVKIWCEIIKKKYPSAQEWLKAAVITTEPANAYYQFARDESGSNSAENALIYLSMRFGFQGSSISSNPEVRCAVGAMIFGADDPDIVQARQQIEEQRLAIKQFREDMVQAPNTVKKKLLEKYPTPAEWYQRGAASRFGDVLPYISLDVLCRQLGKTKFNAFGDAIGMKPGDAVAQWLYEQEAIDLYNIQRQKQSQEVERQQRMVRVVATRKSEKDKIIASVRKMIPHAEQWVNMQWKQRQAFTVQNVDLDTIGITFDITVPPSASMRHHLLLGREIFGKDDPIINGALKQLEETGRVMHMKMPTVEVKEVHKDSNNF
ncbi:MAG: hypothetical protein Q7R81_03315 [Candidatus Peregrinibacteria bacterium]|nr:hypothetical protein [Candidatus Peregrinibacteria bacterium]